jgi:hypothetical protein
MGGSPNQGVAKQVTHAVEFTDPIQGSIGPDRLLFVLACDDGSVYEFQRYEDSNKWNLRARGGTDEPPRTWTSRRAPLPSDVTGTLDETVGEDKWTK